LRGRSSEIITRSFLCFVFLSIDFALFIGPRQPRQAERREPHTSRARDDF
jgi:hypothetical protein